MNRIDDCGFTLAWPKRRTARLSEKGVILKRAIVLTSLIVLLSGCSAYRATNFEIMPDRGLVIWNDSGKAIPESDLIGLSCKIEMHDGSVLDGEIKEISQREIKLTKEEAISAIEADRKYITVVAVTDISDMSIKHLQKERSAGLGILIGIVVLPVVVYVYALRGVYQ